MSKLRGEGVCSRQNFTVDIDAWCVCVTQAATQQWTARLSLVWQTSNTWQTIANRDCSVPVGSDVIQPRAAVHSDLGVPLLPSATLCQV